MIGKFTVTIGSIEIQHTEELDILASLYSGQMFRFVRQPDGWITTTQGVHTLALRQDKAIIHFKTSRTDGAEYVQRFLRLDDLNLREMAKTWGTNPLYKAAWNQQTGVRILSQDPHECLFSFLCASAAPIQRISKMMTLLTEKQGTRIDDLYTLFPSLEQLLSVSETHLRTYGFGFRAPRIVTAARWIADTGNTPERLCVMPYRDLVDTLIQIKGCGQKIADCIALFAYGHDQAIPIDTHIWKLAKTSFAPELNGLSLTPKTYKIAADSFLKHFGQQAGWAQQILFYQSVNGNKQTVAP